MRWLTKSLTLSSFMPSRGSLRYKKTKATRKVVNKKPRLSEDVLFHKFIDTRVISLTAGKGGDGQSHFLRDKSNEFGGPSGGSGGRGGDVVLVSDRNVKSLEHVKSKYTAQDGRDGGINDLSGKYGKDLIVRVPVGTFLHAPDSSDIIFDFVEHGQEFVACTGGDGGKGNKYFVSSTNTTPQNCTPGQPGETMRVVAELRTLAHGGLVGFPNAGKSTMLRALSRAKPAVAEYQFTTLVPHVGVIEYEDFVQVAIADTPGLIEGAHMNMGHGIRFLKHIQRCRFLMYVINMEEPEPWLQLYCIRDEFSKYDFSLTERPALILANKMDLVESHENYPQFIEKIADIFPEDKVLPMSALKKYNLEELICCIRDMYDEDLACGKQQGITIPIEW